MESSKSAVGVGFVIKVLLLSLLCILLFTSHEFAARQTAKESAMVSAMLGKSTEEAIKQDATRWYGVLIADNNVEESVVNFFVPTKDEKANSRGLEDLGKGIFAWVERRIGVFFDLVYWSFKRISLLLVWLPLLVPLLFVSVFDGICQRNIKKENFGLASPFWQKFGTLGSVCVIGSLFLLFCIPFAIPPLWAPVLLALISIFSGIAVGNVQKRL